MDDRDSEQDPASELPTAPPEAQTTPALLAATEDQGAQRGDRRGQMLGKAIAALRRGGLDCCVVLSEGETPAAAEPATISRKIQ